MRATSGSTSIELALALILVSLWLALVSRTTAASHHALSQFKSLIDSAHKDSPTHCSSRLLVEWQEDILECQTPHGPELFFAGH